VSIVISSEAFDPWTVLNEYQKNMSLLDGQYGATAVFIGTMRDFNEGDDVTEMFLEHYSGMTERHLEKICRQATNEYQLLESLVVHRVGAIKSAEPIVLVAVWTEHRKQAFEACRIIMEELKSKAPFWKKEKLSNGNNRWVDKNTKGY
jgi:molybdopterin synthase catalytic subunit